MLKTLLSIEKLEFMRKEIEEQFSNNADWPELRSKITSLSQKTE